MADRVDPAMEPVEPPHPGAVGDRVGVEPQLDELRVGEHAVLARGSARDLAVGPCVWVRRGTLARPDERVGRDAWGRDAGGCAHLL